uniref:3-oxoacyl-acyl-carrier-protein reductase n=1 Tax=Herpetomonas muscarum TaxID=5718 RepID=T1YTU3_HERMU|nr:3-oxoacyl-acyl-carrier-protein reductase [Herpetomonas muscarum]
MSWNVAGKIAVVTGASGALGARVAQRLATQHQMQVACVSRRPFTAALPEGCRAFQADVTDSRSCDALFKAVPADFGGGGVTAVVHCAGVTLNKLLLRCTDEDYDLVMNTNVRGSVNISRAALRYGGLLKHGDASGGASVVLVGSVAGTVGNEGQALYSASKAALSGLAKSLGKEYGAKGVRFNVVAPGLIGGKGMAETLSESQLQVWKQRCPLQRLATPDDVADAIVAVLLSPYMNGQIVGVDGGIS